MRSDGDGYFGMSEAQFTKTLHSNSLVWAPDGDEAFDDSGYVLQFDLGDLVRLIAFRRPDSRSGQCARGLDFVRHLLQRSSALARHLHCRMGVATETRLTKPDGMRRPVSDGMLYAPKLSTCSK